MSLNDKFKQFIFLRKGRVITFEKYLLPSLLEFMFQFECIVASQHEISIKVVVPNSYWALEIPIFSLEHYSSPVHSATEKKNNSFFWENYACKTTRGSISWRHFNTYNSVRHLLAYMFMKHMF